MITLLPLAWLAACPGSATEAKAPPDTAAGTASVTCGAERCNNGVDDDCDGLVDEADDASDALAVYDDADGDGYAGQVEVARTCDAATPFTTTTDCDDADPLVNPAAEEVCDGIDNNCDWHGVPGCEWAGEVQLDEVATMIVRDEISDVAAGIDEETGELWVMTFDVHARASLYHDVHAGRVTGRGASAVFELDVDYYDPWYKDREYVYVACGDVHDLDGDGLSDVIMALNAYDEASDSFARLFAVAGELGAGRRVNLAGAEGSFHGDGWVSRGGSQCGAGFDATGDGLPDVLALGLVEGEGLVLDGRTALAAQGNLRAVAAGTAVASGSDGGGGWADFSGDGVADIYIVDGAPDEGVALLVFQGPVLGAVPPEAADARVRMAATPDFPDRQLDFTGDGRDDLLFQQGYYDENWAGLADGGELLRSGPGAGRPELVARFVGSERRGIQQVAGASGPGAADGAAVMVSHCALMDYSGWGPCGEGGVSVLPGPFSGRVVVADAASLYARDPLDRRVGAEIAAAAGHAFVSAENPFFSDPYGEAAVLYAIALYEAF